MQTFLAYPSFINSAYVLDDKRLGKQRPEAKQILNCLEGTGSNGWQYHPAVEMWRGYENCLRLYANVIIAEWERRGFNNDMEYYEYDSNRVKYPWWFGEPLFHMSHRSNLLRKDRKYYSRWKWREPDNLPYYWPYRRINRQWVRSISFKQIAKAELKFLEGK